MTKIRSLFQKYKEFFKRNERYISGGALLAGFIVDNFTLTRIDLWFDNLILFAYLTVALLAIVVINFYEEGILKGAFFEKVRFLSLLAMQFAFGGLFSGFVVFYSRSATLVSNWPFILVLIGLLIGNEFFKSRYSKFTFRMSIFFIALFSFLIFYVPVIIGSIGALIFILSSVISILFMWAIIRVLRFFIPAQIEKSKNALKWSIGIIFILINIFYFTNIIPPIPLSLKDIGVYHFVERDDAGNYLATSETKEWYYFLIPNETVHIHSGDPIYIFSSVFAPTKLNTDIFHKWQYYDEDTGKWILRSNLGFEIQGGRDGGYRGYTMKTSLDEGLWRVDVVTKRNQLLGRVKFRVKKATKTLELETNIL